MKRRLHFLVLALMICLGLTIPASAAENNSYTPRYGRDPNIFDSVSRGQFVTDGSYFYYVKKGEEIGETGMTKPDRIVKQSINGKTKVILYTSAFKTSLGTASLDSPELNLMDGYIYFKDDSDNIYRLRTDGTSLKCIYKRNSKRKDGFRLIHEMLVIDDRLYFSWEDKDALQNNLLSMKLDGSNIQTVAKNVVGFFARGEWLYFDDRDKYLCYNIHTGAINTVIYRDAVGYIYVVPVGISDDDRFHFHEVQWVDPFTTISLDYYSSMTDGTDWRKEKALKGNAQIIVGNDYLYYSDDGYIYKSSLYNEDTPVRITNKPVNSWTGRHFDYNNGYVYVYNSGFYKVPVQLPTAFYDVAANAYYTDAVIWAVKNGITNGTSATAFSPNKVCTTGEILTLLWKAQGSPAFTISNPFSDVKENDFYYNAALWAYEKGLVSGSTFGASTPCTRSVTVTYLWKLAGKPTAGENSFTDVPGNADYAQAVAWAVNKKITSGTSTTTFSPDATCTRGQIVAFLYRDFAK